MGGKKQHKNQLFCKKRVDFFYTLLFVSAIFLIPGKILALEDNSSKPVLLSSLKEVVQLAFKNNLDIQMQEKELAASRSEITVARSALLPQLNASAAYTKNDKVFFPSIFTGYKNDNQLGVSLTQNIYSGGANTANLKQAQLKARIQGETLRASKLDVEFEAKRLYYGLLLAYETERIAQELFDQAKAHYEDVKQKFSQGTSSRFDVLQSSVQVSKVVPELVKAKNAVELNKADLKKLLRIKMLDDLKIDDHLAYSFIDVNEPEFLKTAYLGQPQMNIKSLGIDVNKWAIQTARSTYRPQVNAAFNYNFRSSNTNNIFTENQRNWSAGVSMSIPIFDGFASRGRVEAAKARYEESFLDKENTIDQIAVDIKKGCLDLREASSIIGYTKDNIGEAREALKISEVSYDNGEGTNLDILDAQVSLSQIEQDYSNAVYDYLMAQAFLDKTMGRLFFEEAGDEKKN